MTEELFDGSAPVPVLRWPVLTRLGVVAVGTTRAGGVSEGPYRSLNLGLHVGDEPARVLENRTRASSCLGVGLDDLVLAEQVHGGTAAAVHRLDCGRGARELVSAMPAADALVTDQAAVVLAVLVADCVPMVLVDPDAGVLACVHAGWRGTVAGIVKGAVGTMERLGAKAANLTALLGPSVSADRYEVDRPVAEAVRRASGDGPPVGDLTGAPLSRPMLRPSRVGHWLVDLPEANRRQLCRTGVAPERIHRSDTTTSDPRLYSHRASGGTSCGRFGLLARLER